MDERLWLRLKPFFYDSYDLIYLKIPIEDSIENIIDSIEKSIKEENINLLGFSLGGYLASYLAIKYPKKIKKLFLISSTLSSLSEMEIEQRKQALNVVKKFGFKGISRKKIKTLISDENNEELVNLISKMYVDLGEKHFFNQMLSTTKRVDLEERFFKLNIPTTFLYASKDNLINKQYFENLKAKSSDIVFKNINTKSHVLPLEYPKEVSSLIKEFFTN